MTKRFFYIATAVSTIAAAFGVSLGASANTTSSARTIDGYTCTILGTERSDRITGTSGDDVICGLGGNDTINSLAGDDVVLGGNGNDRVNGGTGSDTILGGNGNDTVNGGTGDDDVHGEAGNDRLVGEGGEDLVLGGDGRDQIVGGANDDHLGGGPGRDTIEAGGGSDVCGLDGADSIRGACTIDNSPPSMTNLMGNPVFSAGGEAVFSWAVSDSSRVLGSWLNIGGSSGWVTEWCGFSIEATQVGGTSQDGIFEVRCAIPANAPSQSYTAFVYATDIFGTWRGEMQLAFDVVGGSSDTQAPELSDIRFNLTIVGPDDELKLDWTASDESGVKYVVPWIALDGYSFADGQGRMYSETFSQPQEQLSGDKLLGSYSQKITFTDVAPAGVYTLWFSVSDEVGNRNFFQVPITITRVN